MRRIERLLNLVIALVNTPRPYPAEEIRRKVAGYDQETHEAFRRAFERDKEDLRNMGIPIETVTTDPFSEVPDGYIIPKEKYYLPELDLEPDETAALRLAADTVLGVREQAESAWTKLSMDVRPGSWSGPRVVWGADLAAEQPVLAALASALLERAPVTFDYEPATGGTTRRRVEPYSLVHRRGHWYVVGRDRDRNGLRSFKVSRVKGAVRQSGGSYDIPASFRVDDHLAAEAWEIGAEDREAILRFEPRMRWWAEHNLTAADAGEGPDGTLDVRMPVANLDALVVWVIEFGPGVEILAPPEARLRLRAHLSPFLGEEVT